MKVAKTLAAVGLAVSLLCSNISGLAVVNAADSCGHGYIVETTSVIGTRTENHTHYVDGVGYPCTITYTTYQRVSVCGLCGEYLGRSVYETYEHSY